MELETERFAIEHGTHAVHFYGSEMELARTVGTYLLSGLRDGSIGLVIATEDHRTAFEAELRAAGIDAAAARRQGTLIMLDAAGALAGFVRDGAIDTRAFDRVVGGAVRDAARSGRQICAYGEMVALLWDAGDVVLAIELEELWNALLREIRFSLLCAYQSASVSGPDQADALREVCQAHSAVVPIRGEFTAEFEPLLDAPRAARRMVGEVLALWGVDESVTADAELVISELATNAVLHARSRFSVLVRHDQRGVRLGVADASHDEPIIRSGWSSEPAGRGLRIVSSVARGWGVEGSPAGKTVWADLAADGA
jgi:KaiC/GvpD/RAD55 family RecA-like ATPase